MSNYSNEFNHYVMNLENLIDKLSGILFYILKNTPYSPEISLFELLESFFDKIPELLNLNCSELNLLQTFIKAKIDEERNIQKNSGD